MNVLATITLVAFLAALAQLELPLPPEVQTRLEVVVVTDDASVNVAELHLIARNYSQMLEHYYNARMILQRSWDDPAVRAFLGTTLGSLTQIELSQIITVAGQVLSSPEPVAAINQAVTTSSFLQRLCDCLKASVH